MRRTNHMLAALIASGLALSACQASNSTPSSSTPAATSPAASSASRAGSEAVTVVDSRGNQITVPTEIDSVIVTDNRLFETLSDWGVKLSAAPKAIMSPDSPYATDESIVDLGNHREPNLELAVAANPDLILNGQRFANHYDQLKQLLPEAALIDSDIDTEKPLGDELKRQITLAGQVFGKDAEAKALIEDYDKAVARVKAAYKQDQKVMAVITSGGKVNYAAPGSGRTLGPVFKELGLTPSLETEGSSDHQGDEISVEAIAASNPDWILVMDRDAAVGGPDGTEAVPASKVLADSAALQNVTAVQKQQIIYMPNDTYLNEGIQTYTEFFNALADAMEKSA
ncbi:siderophore ABC transporter substrate-binding protein [Arachnia propionica]|uniref:Iron ABC transporter substrate-binding protein n=1 Tax=Arachnia propionica TaxID=1750 RepID=A0A3P1WXA7_9ACTN|nr:ABC transporter substrate-binding protein [Arachnia propionica]RRD50387.1 iron ABC transporter substrate-binding protein [Arachnia propionica]